MATPDELARNWLGYVEGLCGKQARSPTERDDFLSAALIALCKAAQRYDATKGWTFQALVTRSVKNAIIDVQRRQKPETEFREERHLAGGEARLAPFVRRDRKPENVPEPAPPPPPSPRELAVAALRAGASYRDARKAAQQGGRAPSLETVTRWAAAAGIQRRRGRPTKVDPETLRRWLTDPKVCPASWGRRRGRRRLNVAGLARAAGLALRTLHNRAEMFGGVPRLRKRRAAASY